MLYARSVEKQGSNTFQTLKQGYRRNQWLQCQASAGIYDLRTVSRKPCQCTRYNDMAFVFSPSQYLKVLILFLYLPLGDYAFLSCIKIVYLLRFKEDGIYGHNTLYKNR